ncbi:protein translocase subunit SecD [Patescibacteria group bacterium]|nr:protein translocase subunit SecD [Patescibacteria group bacterium]MBU2579428.1 protein translocase subunit SecD [Patescibacteria group bacterium]
MGIFVKNTSEKPRRKKIGSRRIYWTVFLILIMGALAGFFIYPNVWDKGADWVNYQAGTTILPHFYNKPFHLGLDLMGGAHLIYEADFSNVVSGDRMDSMEGARDVIERRVNLFGVAEPVVQINKVGDRYRLIVELAGIKDTHQAIEMIGQTPFLDFREEKDSSETENILAAQKEIVAKINAGTEITEEEQALLFEDPYFKPTLLTGRYLEGAQMQFDQQTYQSQIGLEFDDEGSKMFEDLTRKNVGKRMAIYLDGEAISAPMVQEAISGGKAQITGDFTLEEAKTLVQRLNAGALPVPINLVSQQTVGASLGQVSLDKSLQAAIWGFLAVLLFMIFYYRLLGLISCFSLIIYVALVLAVFKLIPVTLSLAGIAGFILSIGMAVDANILIFERFKEEFRKGKGLGGSIDEGFRRAWSAIRDGNISTIITCLILYIFATGLVKGFALTLGIGVVISMFSAIVVTKSFLRLFIGGRLEGKRKIWG